MFLDFFRIGVSYNLEGCDWIILLLLGIEKAYPLLDAMDFNYGLTHPKVVVGGIE